MRESYQQVWDEVIKRWRSELKKPKVKFLKKIRNQICGACHKTATLPAIKRKNCKRCGGTGKIKDYHYIMIVGKHAYDSDTIK